MVLWPQRDTDTVAEQALQHDVTSPVSTKPVAPVSQPVVPVTGSAEPAAPPRPLPTAAEPVVLRPLPPLKEPQPVTEVETSVTSVAAVSDRVESASVAEAEPRNNNLPVWPQVSGQLFQAINSGLRLDVHVYSKMPDERFVLINMQKYREGEQLQEGPVVDEITPNDVILSFRGQRFRVQ